MKTKNKYKDFILIHKIESETKEDKYFITYGESKKYFLKKSKIEKSRLPNRPGKKDERYLYDYFPEHEKLIESFVDLIKQVRNNKKIIDTPLPVIRSLVEVLKFINQSKLEINHWNEITQVFIAQFYNYVIYLKQQPQKIFLSLSYVANFVPLLKIPKLPRNSKSRSAFSTECAKQIDETTTAECKRIMNNYDLYLKIENEIKNTFLFSKENLYKTWLDNEKQGLRVRVSLILYELYGEKIELSKRKAHKSGFYPEARFLEIKRYAKNGKNIFDHEDFNIMVLWVYSYYPDYKKQYSSHFIAKTINKHKNTYGVQVSTDNWSYFQRNKISEIYRSLPTKFIEKFLYVINMRDASFSNIYPFFIQFLLHTGKNIEVIYSWKKPGYIENEHKNRRKYDSTIFPNSIEVFGTKNKTNSVVMTIFRKDSLLFKYYEFLCRITEGLDEDELFCYTQREGNAHRWVNTFSKQHISKFIDYKPNDNSRFLSKFNIEENGKRLIHIDHQRFRPTWYQQKIFQGMDIKKRQHAMDHKEVDSHVFYEESSELNEFQDLKLNYILENIISEIKFSVSTENIGQTKIIANCLNDKEPDYNDKKLNRNSRCTSLIDCLRCSQAVVIKELHGSVLLALKDYLTNQLNSMGIISGKEYYANDLLLIEYILSMFDTDELERASKSKEKYKNIVETLYMFSNTYYEESYELL